jgi:membrane protein DedA with SNARE-associated domain
VAVPVASILSTLTDALTSLIGDHGLYAVFILMAVDAILPVASELIMVYAGAVAAGAFPGQDVVLFGEKIDSGFWAFFAMAMAGVVGNTVGSVLGWGIGLYGGRPLVERHGRWLHLDTHKLERAERWFDRFGDAAVFLGRVTPVVRSFVSVPAGVFRMKLGRFTVLTFLGCIPWCFALAGVGYAFGSNYERFQEYWHFVDYAVAALIVAGLVYLYVRHRRTRLARRAADPAG